MQKRSIIRIPGRSDCRSHDVRPTVIVEAQSSRLTATIPFNFHVGRDTLPAGKYDVKEIVGSAIRLLSVSGDGAAAIGTIPIWNADGRVSKLVFNRYGNDYFLSEIHWRGSSTARSLVKSPIELELARTTDRREIGRASCRERV